MVEGQAMLLACLMASVLISLRPGGVCATCTTVTIGNTNWEIFDFGDAIPAVPDDLTIDAYNKTASDKDKCLLIHLEAAALFVTSSIGGIADVLGPSLARNHQAGLCFPEGPTFADHGMRGIPWGAHQQ